MIEGEIQPDDLGPGTNNVARINEIRSRLATLHDDALPFLLLPVRVETRFMQVDRPVAPTGRGSAEPRLLDRLTGLRGELDAIAQQDLNPTIRTSKRKIARRRERALYKALDGRLARMRGGKDELLSALRDAVPTSNNDVASLSQIEQALSEAVSAAAHSVGRLRSAYQRHAYGERLAALDGELLTPIRTALRETTIPKFELLSELRFIDATALTKHIDDANTAVVASSSRVRTPGGLAKSCETLEPLLATLRQGTQAVVRGSPSELARLHESWSRLDDALAGLTALTAAHSTSTAGDEGAVMSPPTARFIDSYRRDLAGLANGEQQRIRMLGNQDFAASAQASSEITRLLGTLLRELGAEPEPQSGLVQQTLHLGNRIVSTVRRCEALGQGVVVLPAAQQLALASLAEAVASGAEPWLKRLDRVASQDIRDDQMRNATPAALREAISALLHLAQAQRTDSGAARAAGDSSAPLKILAIRDTATRTVDELWVRVYPDPIAVHTHEEPLTATEQADGQTFWTETLNASADPALRKGAWVALAKKHGSRRAAWIARSLEPTGQLDPPSARPLFDALQTLSRRIDEVAMQPGALRGDTARATRPILNAMEGVRSSLRELSGVAPQELEHMGERMRTIGSQLTGIRSRVERSSRFVSAREPLQSALKTVADQHAELQAGIEALGKRSTSRLADQSRLKFPKVPMRPQTWTVAPHCRVLPEHFVVCTVSGSRVTHVVAGEPVAGSLNVGIDPAAANGSTETIRVDAKGNLLIADSLRWMTDFDEAVKRGMGIRIPITHAEAQAGFDEVLVIGVRQATAPQTKALVQGLLDGHHYDAQGLGFLPIGTPTNNTEEQASGHRRDDDPSKSWEIERGQPLFDVSTTDATLKADGLRFAQALGIDPTLLLHIENAGRHDAGEALLMNEALWPGTIGAYLEEFLCSLISPDSAERVRRFFCEHVSARGWIPALRVGSQPYGVLTTMAFSRYAPSTGSVLPAVPPSGIYGLSEAQRQTRFEILFHELLDLAWDDWSRIRQAKVKHAHSPGVTNPQEHFMEMLGLHPASVSSEYRIGLNVASRYAASRAIGGGMSFGTSTCSPLNFLKRFDPVLRRAFQLPAGDLMTKGLVSSAFQGLYDRIEAERAYTLRYLLSPRVLHGPVVATDAAHGPDTYVPYLLQRTAFDLLREARQKQLKSPALLYLFLRHALLCRYRTAALAILEIEKLVTPEARRQAGLSDEFMVYTLGSPNYVTKWSYLFYQLVELDGYCGIDFKKNKPPFVDYLSALGGNGTLANYLSLRESDTYYKGFPGHGAHDAERAALKTYVQRLQTLAQIPAGRLEPLVYEHLDLCSHRLDAWRLGLANRRLSEMRSSAAGASGLYLGAYGWVENLRPSGPRTLAEGLPPALRDEGAPPVYSDADNDGFIHAPSLSHAVTAAILRSGYLSETDKADQDNRMAVNLTSRRVRLALGLLDGVEAGIDLGTLLGYRFERELHEAYTTYQVTFDDLIPQFRRAFPGRGAIDPDNYNPDQLQRLVTDGLRLLDTVRAWIAANRPLAQRCNLTLYEVLYEKGTYGGYPWGIVIQPGLLSVLPPRTDPRLPAVLRAIDCLADTIDALSDLAVSESVFQIVRGNFPRASAVLSAMAAGKAIPRPQIVETPRGGIVVTHRVLQPLRRFDGRKLSSRLVTIPAVLDENRRAALPPGWSSLPMTPRANAEPGMNYWLGTLLGDPRTIACRYLDPTEAVPVVREVTAADLGLQPVDLLAILAAGMEAGAAELAARITYFALPTTLDLVTVLTKGPRPTLEIRFEERGATWPLGRRTFFEIAALLGSVQEMLGKARPAGAHDLQADEALVEPAAAGAVDWDADEVKVRLEESMTRLRALGKSLMTALNGGIAPVEDVEAIDARAWVTAHDAAFFEPPHAVSSLLALSALVLAATGFGVQLVLPPVRFETVDAVARGIRAAVSNAFVQVASRLRKAGELLASGDPRKLLDASAAAFGRGFLLVPQFSPDAATTARIRTDLTTATLLRNAGAFAMDGWMQGCAAVRESLACLLQVHAVAEAFGATLPSPLPAQLPSVEGDYWLGLAYPPGWQPSGHKLSLIMLDPTAWDFGSSGFAALHLDEWTETIPNRSETTGIAFHYEQPDATPPQALLLAVPPKQRGKWQWDDLVHTLHDTLEVARNRTVELDHLGDEVYAQILPAVTGELVPQHLKSAQGEVSGSRVIFDFEANHYNITLK